MVKFDEVKHVTTEEYFEGNDFSVDAFNLKYKENESETYVSAIWRVCVYVASVEKTPALQKYWAERWFDEIFNDWWHPAGSIMQGAGCGKKISLSNCTHLSLGGNAPHEEWDNLESIFKNTGYSVAKTAAYRQGLGVDFSRLRPRGTTVANSAKESTGAVHWMRFVDQIGSFVGQKGRIPAFLFSLNIKHPDIEEFVKVKSDRTKIQNANISVQITEDFYKAVESGKMWNLEFVVPEVKKGDKIYVDVHSITKDTLKDEKGYYYVASHSKKKEVYSKEVDAKKLLMLVAEQMRLNAEPGIQNIDIARKLSNSDYVYDPEDSYDSRIIGSNAPLVGDTLVPTKEGLFTIKELFARGEAWVLADTISTLPPHIISPRRAKEEKSFVTLNHPTKTIPVLATFRKYENQRVVEIKFKDGRSARCNAEHKWLVNGEMTSTSQIKSGDHISRPNGGIVQAYELTTDYERASFQEGDLLGYVVGDGWIGKEDNSHSKMVGIVYDSSCEEYAVRFKALYRRLTGKELTYERDRGKIKEMRAESTAFTDYFALFGLVNDKYVTPQRCFTDLNFCAGFLRGLFQADGSVSWNNHQARITLTTVSHSLALNVVSLLSSWFGIHAVVVTNPSKGVPYGDGKISNFQTRYNVNISRRGHILRFREYINLIGYKGEKLASVHNDCQDYGNKISAEVVSVNLLNEYEDMYCANIPALHAFVVDGMMSSNCSEQYLSRDSLCVLASLNAGRFSPDDLRLDQEMSIIGPSVNRFLDNVNECELVYQTYATPFQREAIEKLRRTGAGFTNLVDWLLQRKVAYGTEEGNAASEKFAERLNYYLYKSSIELGKEKGNFGLFNREKYEKSPFVKRMVKLGLEFTHMRNVTCSSIAPTGSLSLMFRGLISSYGIEPSFGMYFWKRTRISGKYQYYFCVPRIVREMFADEGIDLGMTSDSLEDSWDGAKGSVIADIIDKNKHKLGIKFKRDVEISAFDKLDLMARVMKWVDSSISVTYSLPESSTTEDIFNFILKAHQTEVKSIAAFPEKKMYGIVSVIPFRELAIKLGKEGLIIDKQNFSEDEQKQLEGGGVTLAGDKKIIKTTAPKRPGNLPADVHHISLKGVEHYVVVGLFDSSDPYEIFTGVNEEAGKVLIPKNIKHGIIVKKKRGEYLLKSDGGIEFPLSGKAITPTINALTRMLSTALRHGADISFIVHQLEKTEGDMWSVGKVLARALKKYIKEGVKVHGDSCPNCGNSQLIRQDGCIQCSCGWTRCS